MDNLILDTMFIFIIYYVYNHSIGGYTTQLELLNRREIVASKEQYFANFQAPKMRPEALIIQHAKTLESALQNIFPEKQEITRIEKARLIMGEDIKNLSDEELDVYLTKFQYLIDCWLDEFERLAFDNKTLREVLMEG